MKVLVTGGAGYIGSHATYELIRAGHDVVIFDDLSKGLREAIHKDALFVEGDVTKAEDLDALFVAHPDFDVVMHFAAKIVVSESVQFPEEYHRVNVGGTRTLIDAMDRHNVRKIIFSSTAAVYKQANEDGFCYENDYLFPQSPYGETKLACEKLLQAAQRELGIAYTIFRYFNVAGADRSLEIGLDRDELTHLIPCVIQAALGIRDKVVVYGDDYPTFDGTCVRDYIHVSDIARAHVMAAERLMVGGGSTLINLGSSKGFSVFEVIKEVEKYLPVPYVVGPRRPGDAAALVAANHRAKEILDWAPKYTLPEIIQSDLAFREKIKG